MSYLSDINPHSVLPILECRREERKHGEGQVGILARRLWQGDRNQKTIIRVLRFGSILQRGLELLPACRYLRSPDRFR